MTEDSPPDTPPDGTRRVLLSGICGVACAAAVTACGGQHGSDVPPAARPVQGTPPPSAAGGSTAPVLAPTSDIPVGGGTVFPEYRLVVTQPAAGDLAGLRPMPEGMHPWSA
jgi:hypothetical protein